MWIYVASRIPVYVCYLVVTLWYLFNAVYDLGIICFKGFRRAVGICMNMSHACFIYVLLCVIHSLVISSTHPDNTLNSFQYIRCVSVMIRYVKQSFCD